MRLLVVGNSQAGVLKQAHDIDPKVLGVSPFFYVVPGGTGPYLRVENDRLVVTMSIDAFPPRIDPPEANAPLSSFDAIVVSALGYADGGFQFRAGRRRQTFLGGTRRLQQDLRLAAGQPGDAGT
ncbi:MAG: hypothetical protein ACK4S3_10220, partial [Parvibaculum sp.]